MPKLVDELKEHLTNIISETNGITLNDTIELALLSERINEKLPVKKSLIEFKRLLSGYQQDEVEITTLLNHPVTDAMFLFFKSFPLPFNEEHIHLTGSLTADFIFPRLKKQLEGPYRDQIMAKIHEVYDDNTIEINNVDDVEDLIRLKDQEAFDRYLQILLLPKLILKDRETHKEAAFHLASTLYHNYNVGYIRLKFTFSRASTNPSDQIPGVDNLTEEDAVMGLLEGFLEFKKKVPTFDFTLSPCFRKEAGHFDNNQFNSKKDHFNFQIDQILELKEKYPVLDKYLTDVDTVGNERELYRKSQFMEMYQGFRKLHYKGFSIRSHHGETWYTLRKGVQAVDNSFNIWHIDTLEHGLSLGINPNYYYHSLFQRILVKNEQGIPIKEGCSEFLELEDMNFRDHESVKDKIVRGIPLDKNEIVVFTKAKFHVATEIEHYQHDVLNRMIQKDISLIALPTSNNKLTGSFPDYKDHPFSWWEKKGVRLGVGTDNYITLDTNYIQELLILLYTDAASLKITKLLMVATGETRRPYLSQYLWKMRK